MFSTSLIQKYEYLKSDLRGKRVRFDEQASGGQDDQIIEEYEGACEECEMETRQKDCPICKS